MTTPTLRPPLPAPLSHEGIAFVFDRTINSGTLSAEIISAIAAALHETLPPGDIFVDANGAVHIRGTAPHAHTVSLWYQAGLLAGIERSSL